MLENVFWIPLLPLIASAMVLLSGRDSERPMMPLLSVAAMGWCLAHSTLLFHSALTGGLDLPYCATVPWFDLGPAGLRLGVLVDGPAAAMLFVVSLVSFLVHVYSLGCMRGAPRLKRYYACLGFFSAAMLGLVVASDLMLLFVCWELLAAASYLLIGFRSERPEAARAGKKAFLATKLGDLGLMTGLLLLYSQTGTFDLGMLAERARMGGVFFPESLAAAAALLILFGAAGMSAQAPLFVWLPDSVEAPAPVSALIHSATMVAAGVYLVVRTYFIFALSPVALEVLAWAGMATAVLGAAMALTPYDIRRTLAFSTISQLGLMMMGLGAGGYTAGVFYLTTHAFSSALLFLGAGSVVRAVRTDDMRLMGGVSNKLPATFLTMAAAALAVAGFPFLSGWHPKTAILRSVYLHSPAMWAVALAAAGLSAFCVFRLMFLTFLGKSRDHHRWEGSQESPPLMTWPLWLLAGLSVVSGVLLEYEGLFAALVRFDPLTPLPSNAALPAAVEGVAGGAAGWAAGGAAQAAAAAGGAAGAAPGWLAFAAAGVFAAGAYLAYRFYSPEDHGPAKAARGLLAPVVAVLERRCGFDDAFLSLVRLSDRLAARLRDFDAKVLDAVLVDGVGLLAKGLAAGSRFFDDFFVDGAVDGTGEVAKDAGAAMRRFFMAGSVQEYLLFVSVTVAVFTIFVQMR